MKEKVFCKYYVNIKIVNKQNRKYIINKSLKYMSLIYLKWLFNKQTKKKRFFYMFTDYLTNECIHLKSCQYTKQQNRNIKH